MFAIIIANKTTKLYIIAIIYNYNLNKVYTYVQACKSSILHNSRKKAYKKS